MFNCRKEDWWPRPPSAVEPASAGYTCNPQKDTSIFPCRKCGQPVVVTGVTCSGCVGIECEEVNQALHACLLNAKVQAPLAGQKYAKPVVVIPQDAWDRLVKMLKEELEPS